MEMDDEKSESSGEEIIEEFSEKWVDMGGTVSKSKEDGSTVCTFSGASNVGSMSKEMFEEYSDKKKK